MCRLWLYERECRTTALAVISNPGQGNFASTYGAELYLLHRLFTAGPLPVHLQSVPSVEEALTFLRRAGPYGQAPRPQLIVTSINLPGKSGFDLLAAVKRDPALRPTPVIVLSAYSDAAVIRRSYALGANSYIIKPRELDAFAGAIRAMKEYWLTVTTLPEPVSAPRNPAAN